MDAGKFNWAQNKKISGLSKPKASYHGAVFTEAFGNLAYIKKLCTTLLRDREASTTHAQLSVQELLSAGIKPNMIRISIGTEHIDDSISDLEHAFKAVR